MRDYSRRLSLQDGEAALDAEFTCRYFGWVFGPIQMPKAGFLLHLNDLRCFDCI
jgi:hypothetical protein